MVMWTTFLGGVLRGVWRTHKEINPGVQHVNQRQQPSPEFLDLSSAFVGLNLMRSSESHFRKFMPQAPVACAC
jgi:hypothetical protein